MQLFFTGGLTGQNESITWSIKGRDPMGDLIHIDAPRKVSQTIFKSKAGVDGTTPADGTDGAPAYNSSGSNDFHLFVADENGLVDGTANNFSTSFTVSKGGTAYTFSSTGTSANTFGITLGTATNCVGSVSSTGIVSLSTSNSSIFTTGSITDASLEVEIFDREDNTVIETKTLRFSKVKQAVRDGVSFSFSNVGTTHGPAWVNSSLTNSTAQFAALKVIQTSVDGFSLQMIK